MEIFIDIKSFRSYYVLGFDSASNGNEYFLGVKAAGAQGWQPYHHPVPLSWNLGTLTSWNPLGQSRPLMGLIYLYSTDVTLLMKLYLKYLFFSWINRFICLLSFPKKFQRTLFFFIYREIKKDGLNFVRLYFLNYTWYVNDLPHNIWKRNFSIFKYYH